MGRTIAESIAHGETFVTVNATSVITLGRKKVNNFDQCTRPIVQAGSHREKSMQSSLHGISDKPSSTNRRGY